MKHAIALLTLSVMFLASCGPTYLTNNDLSLLHKGMTRAKFDEVITVKPEKEFKLKSGGKTYDVAAIELLTGISKSTSSSYSPGVGGGAGSWTSTTTTTAHTNYSLFLYLDGKLRYWGMKNEYSKCEDKEIADIAPELYKEFDKQFD